MAAHGETHFVQATKYCSFNRVRKGGFFDNLSQHHNGCQDSLIRQPHLIHLRHQLLPQTYWYALQVALAIEKPCIQPGAQKFGQIGLEQWTSTKSNLIGQANYSTIAMTQQLSQKGMWQI